MKSILDKPELEIQQPPNDEEFRAWVGRRLSEEAAMFDTGKRKFDGETFLRLAQLSPAEYDRCRDAEAKALGVRVRTLDGEIARMRKRDNNAPKARLADIPCPELDGDVLALVDTAVADSGYGGDRKVPILLYLCCTSRLLAFKAGGMLSHAQVIGAPSSGKNFAVDTVLRLLPEDSYVRINAGTPKALIYNDADLQHRIVFFSEADSMPTSEGCRAMLDGDSRATASSALRSLASDGYLSFQVPEKGEDGKFVTREIKRDGPTLLITTTVKALEGQMGTRVMGYPY